MIQGNIVVTVRIVDHVHGLLSRTEAAFSGNGGSLVMGAAKLI